jgi:hypothetical protein
MSDNFIPAKARGWGMTRVPAAGYDSYTKPEMRILQTLLDAVQPCGGSNMINRATLKTSANKMQELFCNGWVNGAGSTDDRGSGNTPESSWWWLTKAGEAVARKVLNKELAA